MHRCYILPSLDLVVGCLDPTPTPPPTTAACSRCRLCNKVADAKSKEQITSLLAPVCTRTQGDLQGR